MTPVTVFSVLPAFSRPAWTTFAKGASVSRQISSALSMSLRRSSSLILSMNTGRFARDFLRSSGCRAVAGYTTDVNWMDSMLTDLLFLRRFYADLDPWRNLRQIHDSVLEDFAPARSLGHVLHIRGR